MQVGDSGGWEGREIKGLRLRFGNSPFNEDNGVQREIGGFSTKMGNLVMHWFIQFINKVPYARQVLCRVLDSSFFQEPRFK